MATQKKPRPTLLRRAPEAAALAPCAPTRPFAARPPLEGAQAASLAALFSVLANDTRLRLLHAMVRAGERCVSDMAGDVGLSVQAVSNQLARLSDQRIVASRRDGTRLYYRIVDPCVITLLDRGLCLIEETTRGE